VPAAGHPVCAGVFPGTGSAAADVTPRHPQSDNSIHHLPEFTMTTLRHSQAVAMAALLLVLAALFALLVTLSVQDNTPVQIARPPNVQIKQFRGLSA
jgi:hypothetical protein